RLFSRTKNWKQVAGRYGKSPTWFPSIKMLVKNDIFLILKYNAC
ncbi:MAG: hypothetical protein ACI9RO_000391, partial [Alteromonas macleodii]